MSLEFEHLISEDLTPKRLRYVYHYTSLDSFRKIVSGENKGGVCFKASNCDALNDTSEFLTGMEFLLDIWKNCYHEPEEYLQEMKHKLDLRKSKTFVVSFSSNKDSLPMWAMYAGFNGLALKFNFKHLKRSIFREDTFFLKCFYGRDKLKRVLVNLEKENTVPSKIEMEELILFTPYLLKHPSYKHEKEIRCVIESNDLTNEFEHYIWFPKESLAGVVLPPTQDQESLKCEVEDILKSCGYQEVPIEFSSIPYRNVERPKY